MSFILDALKKSETDRQQRSSAEFAGIPTSSDRPGAPRWLWALGLLLAINLVVLIGLLLRSSAEPGTLPSTIVTESESSNQGSPADVNAPAVDPIVKETSFAEQVAAARQPTQPQGDPAMAAVESAPAPPPPEPRVTESPTNSATLPTIYEVITDGTVVLPELHLDIHVYSDVPKDRFVFINMSKHREQSQLSEGPVVEEITPEGVVLEYRGTTFLLPRE